MMHLEAARQKSLRYIRDNFEHFKEDLRALIQIPSISFEGFDPSTLSTAAHKVKDLIEATGLCEKVSLIRMKGAPPYVYGETKQDPKKVTVLLYAHYDVQPPMREALWHSKPFAPEERRGRLYGRGAADDKGGVMAHISVLKALREAVTHGAELPCNLKILIDGEEEIGSPHLKDFIARESKRLDADVMIVMDAENIQTNIGCLTTSLRGVIVMEVKVSAMKEPLHSGNWGGVIPDPVMGLMKCLSSVIGEDGHLNFQGLPPYKPPEASRLKAYRRLGLHEEALKRQVGLLKGVNFLGGRGGKGGRRVETLLQNRWDNNALTVNGIDTGGGRKVGNVLMNDAWARISVRVGAHTQVNTLCRLLQKALIKHCPWGLAIEIQAEPFCDGWHMQPHDPYKQAMLRALEKAYGRGKAFEIGCGGTIPFVTLLSQTMQRTSLLLSAVADPQTKAHGENESLHLGTFKKAIISELHFLYSLASKKTMKS